MNKEEVRDKIHNAGEDYAKAIKQIIGEDSRVGIFYTYLDNDEGEWMSGECGNMNMVERYGAMNYIQRLQEERFRKIDDEKPY